jgi:hypothetical protein
MTIPTQDIQALRDRAQEVLDPLPYQKARLLPVLRRDRPVRFAAVEVDSDLLACLVDESPHTFKGFELHPVQRVTGHWPAAQIVELCDAVLELRGQSLVRECIEYESPPDDLESEPRRGSALQQVVATFAFSGTKLAGLSEDAERVADRIREQRMVKAKHEAREQVIASLGMPPGVVAPGTPARIKAALLALPFVDSARVEENRTLETVDGMPPKSVRVTVGPKLQENERRQVAEVIDGELPIGIETCSTVGPGWCVVVGDRTIQFNEAPAHCGDSHALAVKAIKGPGSNATVRRFTSDGSIWGRVTVPSATRVGGTPLYAASGEELDRLGELVGLERAGDTDKQYRARISLTAPDPKYFHLAIRPMAKVGSPEGPGGQPAPAPQSIHDLGHCGCAVALMVRESRGGEEARCSGCGSRWHRWPRREWRRIHPGARAAVELARRSMAKVGAIDVVKTGGVDFGHEPDAPPMVSTFKMTEDGLVLADVQEHRQGYGSGGTGLLADDVAAAEANIKRTFEDAEQDGRIHYTDDPVSKPDPRERLRREMTKERW